MVILDMMLPDGNGLEICTQLKAHVKTHHTPVMMRSANNPVNVLKSESTAEDFINKPFDMNDFAGRVGMVFTKLVYRNSDEPQCLQKSASKS